MPKMRKIAGAWHTVVDRYRKVDGVWRKVVDSYRKIDGVWVKIFGQAFLQPIVNNPAPQSSDAGVYFDSASSTYRAYIYGRPSTSGTVEAGIKIANIPANSEVSMRLATYDSIPTGFTATFYSGSTYLGYWQANRTAAYTTYKNVTGELTIYLHFVSSNTSVDKMNFALSDVKINGASISMP